MSARLVHSQEDICDKRLDPGGDSLFHFFDVLLTVHLSIILAINQLNAQNLLL